MSGNPPNSTVSSVILMESALYVGINLQDVMYGIQLVLYFKTMRIFLARERVRRKSDVFYALFSSVLVFLITIWVASAAVYGQNLWLLDQSHLIILNPSAKTPFTNTFMAFGMTSIIILQQMTDGLLVYRCRLVWNSLRAIIIPSILWLVNFALGILLTWSSSMRNTTIYQGIAAKLGITYYCVSVFLNVTLTCMICYWLACHGKKVKQELGEEHASPYFSVVALLVESALPYTLAGVAFLVVYGLGSQTSVAFADVYTLMMCLSPQMLILRVAQGDAWKWDSSKVTPSAIVFSVGSEGLSQCSDGDGRVGVVVKTMPNSGKGDEALV